MGSTTVEEQDIEALFSEQLGERLRHVLTAHFGEQLDELGRCVELALAPALGPPQELLNREFAAVADYVAHYRTLMHTLLDAASHFVVIIDNLDAVEAVLDVSAAEAPFSRWAAALGVRDGTALHALASVRAMLPEADPLALPEFDTTAMTTLLVALQGPQTRRFLRAVHRALDEDGPPLERIKLVLGLSNTGLGDLFGVTRQAVSDWMERGVPAERQEKVAAIAALCDLLEHKLKRSRIPGVARRRAEAYGGETMLSMIAADRHGELLSITRASFEWSQAA